MRLLDSGESPRPGRSWYARLPRDEIPFPRFQRLWRRREGEEREREREREREKLEGVVHERASRDYSGSRPDHRGAISKLWQRVPSQKQAPFLRLAGTF